MGKSKTFLELSKSIEVLNENAQGQLKGGFAVFSSNELITDLEDSNSNCTNNCRCKNKNRGKDCSGCSVGFPFLGHLKIRQIIII